MIPNCKHTAELLSQGQDRPLTPVEQLRLRLHLLLCDGCRNFSRQLEFMRRALRRYRDRD
ncbi:MAG: zf-HC2 domain-containing protein [Burkholderiales bacterium]|nr:zf-HC2 domain-containing protein [Burkholderiales bacterium]